MFISVATLLLASTTLYMESTQMSKSQLSVSFTANSQSYILPVGASFSLPLSQYYEDGDKHDYYLQTVNERILFFSLEYHEDSTTPTQSYFLYHNYLQSNLYFGFAANEVENSWYDYWTGSENVNTFMRGIEYRLYGDSTDLTDYSALNLTFYFGAYDESTFEYLTDGDYQSGYADGYTYGYTNGYKDGEDTGFVNGVAEGQTTGYNNGYQDGYALGYQNGKTDGLNEATPLQVSFLGLLGAIADTPVVIIKNLYSFDIFGTSALTIFMTLLTAIVVIHFIRKGI